MFIGHEVLPLPPTTFENRVAQWLRVAACGESACIMSAPLMDRSRRIQQLLHTPKLLSRYLPTKFKYHFITVDFQTYPTLDRDDLEQIITRKLNNSTIGVKFNSIQTWITYLIDRQIRVVIIVNTAEAILKQQNTAILHLLGSLPQQTQNISLLLFFETNINTPANLTLLKTQSTLLENKIHYPLYQKQDMLQFIKHLEKDLHTTVRPRYAEQIANKCGGHTLIVKQAVRYIRNHPQAKLEAILNHEDLNMKLDWVFKKLDKQQQQILTLISQNKNLNNQDQSVINYLQKVNLIDQEHQITIPLLQKSLSHRKLKQNPIFIEQDTVYLQKVPLSQLLSEQEYSIIKLLLTHKNHLVTRDQIAEAIWPQDTATHYSEWAIDQLLKRTRTKLKELNLHHLTIKTIRGKGYLLKAN